MRKTHHVRVLRDRGKERREGGLSRKKIPDGVWEEGKGKKSLKRNDKGATPTQRGGYLKGENPTGRMTLGKGKNALYLPKKMKRGASTRLDVRGDLHSS